MTYILGRESHIAGYMRKVSAFIFFQCDNHVFHGRSHFGMTLAVNLRIVEIPEYRHRSDTRRNRINSISCNVAWQWGFGAVDQPVNGTESRRRASLVAQQPGHAAAVEAMGRSHSVPAAAINYAERIVASPSCSFKFKLVVAARRLDNQHDSRQRILDQRIDPLIGAVGGPVNL